MMRLHLAVVSVLLIASFHAELASLDPGHVVQEAADTLAVLRVTGEVKKPLSLTLADIAALPHRDVTAEIHERSVRYHGVELGELTPDFTDRTVLLADARDGESLPDAEGPLRLVVPDEREAARWVRQLLELEVRRVR